VGDALLDDFWLRPWGWVFVYGSLAVVLALVVVALRRPGRDWRAFAAQCFGYSALYLAVPCMARGTENFLDKAIYNLNGSRYTVLPTLLLVPLVAGLLERGSPRMRADKWRRMQAATAIWAAFVVLASYSIPTTRSLAGPRWSDNFDQAVEKCEGRRLALDNGAVAGPARPRPKDEVRIYVVPVTPPVWHVTATCRQVTGQ
jgi:hypothetical protein